MVNSSMVGFTSAFLVQVNHQTTSIAILGAKQVLPERLKLGYRESLPYQKSKNMDCMIPESITVSSSLMLTESVMFEDDVPSAY